MTVCIMKISSKMKLNVIATSSAVESWSCVEPNAKRFSDYVRLYLYILYIASSVKQWYNCVLNKNTLFCNFDVKNWRNTSEVFMSLSCLPFRFYLGRIGITFASDLSWLSFFDTFFICVCIFILFLGLIVNCIT